jgi:uncharacterized protein
MYQTWRKLLFLHWPIAPDQLRPLIPAALEIDTWEETAWIALTPFTIDGIRPPLLPPLPLISASHELNFRTYVHRDGIPADEERAICQMIYIPTTRFAAPQPGRSPPWE